MKLRQISMLCAMIAVAGVAARAQDWVQTSGPEGGLVMSAVATDQQIFANVYGRIYRHDGSRWTRVSEPHLNGKLLTVGSTLLISTSFGVFRSSDQGVTWVESDLRAPYGLQVTVDGSIVYGQRNDTLFRSLDGARSWEIVGTMPPATGWLSVHDGAMLASRGAFALSGLFRSTDTGRTWDEVQSGFPASIEGILSITASSDGFYVAHHDGVFKSTDRGTSWTKITAALPNPHLQKLVAAGGEVYIWTGLGVHHFNGVEWKQLDDLSHIYDVTPSSNGALVSTMRGLFRYENGSATSLNTGLRATDIAVFGSAGGAVFAAALDGAYVTYDEGVTWRLSGDFQVNRFASIGGTMFALGDGLHRMDDEEGSWTPIHENIISEIDMPVWQVTSIATLGTTIYATAGAVFGGEHGSGGGWTEGSVYRSTDNGNTWEQINSGLYHNGFTWAPVGDIIATDDYLLISTAVGIYRSTNGGDRWVLSNSGIPDREGDEGGALRKAGDRIYFFRYRELFVSTNEGKSWLPVTSLPERGELIEPYGGQGVSVVGDDLYVRTYAATMIDSMRWRQDYWHYRFDGATWTEITPTLPTGASFLTFFEHQGTLYAGSAGEGVWKRAIPSNVAVDAPRGTALHATTTPNPFASATTLSISLPSAGQVRASVLDLLGNEVRRIHDGPLSAGAHELGIDGAGLVSGTYIVRIESGGTVTSQRIIRVE